MNVKRHVQRVNKFNILNCLIYFEKPLALPAKRASDRCRSNRGLRFGIESCSQGTVPSGCDKISLFLLPPMRAKGIVGSPLSDRFAGEDAANCGAGSKRQINAAETLYPRWTTA